MQEVIAAARGGAKDDKTTGDRACGAKDDKTTGDRACGAKDDKTTGDRACGAKDDKTTGRRDDEQSRLPTLRGKRRP